MSTKPTTTTTETPNETTATPGPTEVNPGVTMLKDENDIQLLGPADGGYHWEYDDPGKEQKLRSNWKPFLNEGVSTDAYDIRWQRYTDLDHLHLRYFRPIRKSTDSKLFKESAFRKADGYIGLGTWKIVEGVVMPENILCIRSIAAAKAEESSFLKRVHSKSDRANQLEEQSKETRERLEKESGGHVKYVTDPGHAWARASVNRVR